MVSNRHLHLNEKQRRKDREIHSQDNAEGRVTKVIQWIQGVHFMSMCIFLGYQTTTFVFCGQSLEELGITV